MFVVCKKKFSLLLGFIVCHCRFDSDYILDPQFYEKPIIHSKGIAGLFYATPAMTERFYENLFAIHSPTSDVL